MSRQEEFEINDPSSRLNHFANIASLACKGKHISEVEQAMLEKMARKLEIPEDKIEEVLKDSHAYPVSHVNSKEQRPEYLFDLFKMIYSDNRLDEVERLLIKRFAIGMGFQPDQAEKVIQRSIKLFSGKFSFDDYQYFINQE